LAHETAFLSIPVPYYFVEFTDPQSRLCQLEATHTIKGVQEPFSPVIVFQYTVHDPPPRSDTLNRHFHDPIEKRAKFHFQKLSTPASISHHKGKPGFQIQAKDAITI
jgi:hypothetical protein